MMYILNVHENDLAGESALAVAAGKKAGEDGLNTVILSGKIEAEIAALDPRDQEDYRRELNLTEDALDRLIHAGYRLLGLITFYTTVGVELRAWAIPRNTPAQKAAGKIHTDMERGFIKAEVIAFDDYVNAGTDAAARDRGLIRTEGREYIIQDGDVVKIKFNV